MNQTISAVLTGITIGLIGTLTGIIIGIRSIPPAPHFASPIAYLYHL